MPPGDHRYLSLSKGLFGRHHSMEEQMELMTLEIEKIKGILSMSKGSIPASKKDMLLIALKDKEQQLRLIKESQEAKLEAEKAQKLAEENQSSEQSLTEEAKKNSAQIGDAEEAKKEEQPKMSARI